MPRDHAVTVPRPQTGTARKQSKAEHRRRAADDRPLMTVAEAAAYLNVGTWTLYRWINDERIPAHRLGPRSMRVAPADLDAFLAAAAVA